MWRIPLFLAAVFCITLCSSIPPRGPASRLLDEHTAVQDTPPASAVTIRSEGSPLRLTAISLSGNPTQMGYQQGRRLREEIRAAVVAALNACAGAGPAGWRMCRKRAEDVQRALPPMLMEEARGIAQGAGVSEMDILLLHSGLWPETGTCFAAWGKATWKENVLLGGVLPIDESIEPVIVIRQPAQGRPTALLSMPGGLGGWAGLNDEHLGALAIPVQTVDAAREGLPATIVLRLALEESVTPEEGLASIMRLPHTGGAHILVGKEQAGVKGVEFSARQQRELLPRRDVLASTGLYFDPDLSLTQTTLLDPKRVAELQVRWDMLERELQANAGWINVDKSLAVLQSLSGDEPGVMLVLEPAEGSLWIRWGRQTAGHFLVLQPWTLFSDIQAGHPQS